MSAADLAVGLRALSLIQARSPVPFRYLVTSTRGERQPLCCYIGD